MDSLTFQIYLQHVHSVCKVSPPPQSASNLCLGTTHASLLIGPSGGQTFVIHLMTTDVPLSSVLSFSNFLFPISSLRTDTNMVFLWPCDRKLHSLPNYLFFEKLAAYVCILSPKYITPHCPYPLGPGTRHSFTLSLIFLLTS